MRSTTKCAVLAALIPAAMLPASIAAAEEDGIAATARCNGKWVVVVTDQPASAILVSRSPGRDWIERSTSTFVPDVGGAYAAGDYDITIELQVWDRQEVATRVVLRQGRVATPNCSGVQRATVELAPAVTVSRVHIAKAAEAAEAAEGQGLGGSDYRVI